NHNHHHNSSYNNNRTQHNNVGATEDHHDRARFLDDDDNGAWLFDDDNGPWNLNHCEQLNVDYLAACIIHIVNCPLHDIDDDSQCHDYYDYCTEPAIHNEWFRIEHVNDSRRIGRNNVVSNADHTDLERSDYCG
ncbi:MAG: hypothetical protein ACKO2Q_09805, partial [Actinomycetota bacterium]